MRMVPSNNANTNQRPITWLIIVLASVIIAFIDSPHNWLKPMTLSNSQLLCRMMPPVPAIRWIAVQSNPNASQCITPSPRTLPLAHIAAQITTRHPSRWRNSLSMKTSNQETAGLRRLFDYFCPHKEELSQIEQRVIAIFVNIRLSLPQPSG